MIVMDDDKTAETGGQGQSYEERRKAILARAEEELEEYSRRGVVSPGALKAARWISRALWLAMTALVVILLFRQQDSVPKGLYDRTVQDLKDKVKEADRYSEQLSEINSLVLVEAMEQGVLSETRADRVAEVLKQILGAGRKVGDELRAAHGLIVRLAEMDGQNRVNVQPQLSAGEVWELYRKADAAEKLGCLAWALRLSGPEMKENVAAVAVSSRPIPERLLAIRWRGAKDDPGWIKVLQGIAEGRGQAAEEAKATLGTK